MKAGKNIRINDDGMENFSDYFTGKMSLKITFLIVS